jgi:hypothetical protein
MPIVTRESLQLMLDEADEIKRAHIIGRALVVLFNRQTEDEKAKDSTENLNSVGFSGADARVGCLTAKSYLAHKREAIRTNTNPLQPWQIEKWFTKGSNGYSRICKYARQLNEAAEAKAQALTTETK